MKFADRREAGRILGELVVAEAPHAPIVTALPRGGVPVGFEVASALRCPLDLILVRKVGLPGQPELAIGAVSEGGFVYQNRQVIAGARISQSELDRAVDLATRELDAKIEKYRGSTPRLDLGGHTVLVVDDGLATGSTAMASIEAVRQQDPSEVWVCVPVAPRDTIRVISGMVDRVVVAAEPARFVAVGFWYRDFTQTTDDLVAELLRQSRAS